MTLSSLQRDESVVGWSQTKLLAEPVWENRTKGKRDINTWWWPTHPTNQHALCDWHSHVRFWFWKYFCVFWWYPDTVWVTRDSFNLYNWTNSNLDWHIPGLISPAEWDKILPSWIFSSQKQDDDGKPPRTTLRFLKKQTEDDQPPRSDGCWRQGWQKSGFPRNIQVRILWMNWRQFTWPVFYLSKFHQRDKIQLDAVSYFKHLCFHKQQLNPSC